MYWQPPVYFLATALWYRIVGFGLFQVRLLSIVFGLLCLISWFTIVRGLARSAVAGLLAMGLISVDYFFLIGASHGRMDIMCVGFGSLGLAAYVRWHLTNARLAIFSGHTLAALAVFSHPVGIVWAVALLLAMWFFDRRLLSFRLLVIGALPYLLGASAWGVYIAQDTAAFHEQMRAILAENQRVFYDPNFSGFRPIQYLEQEIVNRYAAPFGLLPDVSLARRLKAVVLVAYLGAVCGILAIRRLRSNPAVAWFAAIFIASFFLLAEVSPSKYSYYLPHTTVMLAACFSVFLSYVTSPPAWRSIATAVAILAGIQLAGIVHLARSDDFHRQFQPAVAAIRHVAGSNARVMASNHFWLGLWDDPNFLTDPTLGFLSGLRPDVFVMDPLSRSLHAMDKERDPAKYSHVQSAIENSNLIFDNNVYQIYTQKSNWH